MTTTPSPTPPFKMGGQSPITFDRFIRGLIGIIVLALIGVALYYLSSALIPFFVAWVVAYLLFPVVRFFQHTCRLRNRLVSIIITLVLEKCCRTCRRSIL